MRKSHAQQNAEWSERVAKSKNLQRLRGSFTANSLLSLGLLFILCGVYGALKAWHLASSSNPARIVGRDPRGLEVSVTDDLARFVGIATVGIVAIWTGIGMKRKREKNNDDKVPS